MIKEWLAKQRMKATVSQVFKSGDMGVTYSYGDNKGMVYPKIRNVKFDYGQKTVICYFSLPTGMDPKEIKKKEYCFQQVFGKNIELNGDIKEFSLKVYTATLPLSVTYDFERYSPMFEEMTLPIIAGIDLNANIIVFDLLKNPHILIAGETGSGKSTQLRSVLATIIQALPPERQNYTFAI